MKQAITKNLRLVLIVLSVLIACSFALQFAGNIHAKAITTVKAQILNKPQDYRHFSDAYSVYSAEDKLIVADSFGAHQSDINQPYLDSLSDIVSLPSGGDKVAKLGSEIVQLNNGKITVGSTTYNQNSYIDFSIYNANLYALSNSTIYNLIEGLTVLNHTTLTNQTVNKFTVTNNAIYLAVSNANNKRYDDILCYALSDGGIYTLKASIFKVDKVIQLNAGVFTDSVLCLNSSGLHTYTLQGNGLKTGAVFTNSNLVSFTTNGANIFALTSLNSVIKVATDLKSFSRIYASADSANGFYHAPSRVSSRKGNIYIADQFNNRAVITGNSQNTLSSNLIRPRAVTADFYGNIFVAAGINEIYKFNQDYSSVEKVITSTDGTVIDTIIDIKFNSNNQLHFLTSAGALYRQDNLQELPKLISDKLEFVNAFDISKIDDTLYYATVSGANSTDIKTVADANGNSKVLCSPNYTITDFILDHDDSVYALVKQLDKSTIVKYSDGAEVTLPQIENLSLASSSLAMNTLTLQTLSYGDILVSDSNTNNIKVLSGKALETNKNFNTTTAPPSPDTESPPDVTDSNIIYTTTANCEVFSVQAEVNVIETLPENMRIIVPNYDAQKKFNLIYADNIKGGNEASIISGYVYTQFIKTPPMPYTTRHASTCYTFIPNVRIYTLPSRNAPAYKNYQSLAKDTKLILLDFAYSGESDSLKYGYVDNFNTAITWYRVSFIDADDKTKMGYVTADFISVRGANPDSTVYPRKNAKIIAKDKKLPNIGAVIYEKNEDGQFVAVTDLSPIAIGTDVEVLGTFDTSHQYTLIRYLSSYGTVEVYVETVNLKYNGVNAVQVVAIVIILLTVILGSVIVIRIVYIKKHPRLDKTDI